MRFHNSSTWREMVTSLFGQEPKSPFGFSSVKNYRFRVKALCG